MKKPHPTIIMHDDDPIDTSDIPEVGEDWFRKARSVHPSRSDQDGIYEVRPDGSLVKVGDHLPLTHIEPVLSRGQCPDCLADNWRPGPRGGASQNIECRNCLARFNVTIFNGLLVFAQRIESEADGGSHWREDVFPQ